MALNNIPYFDLEAMRGQNIYFFERMKLVLQSTHWQYPEALHRQVGLMLTPKGHASPSIIFP
jgi:hypothetical protein